ncbi:MAG TPA: ABC transporter permease, partial [Gemmatimonadaceae bacterium]|nr:ABC transporter permease [Gemmatimonadaceae bacterium]
MSEPSRWHRYLHLLRPNVDADIDAELRFHLEARTRDFEALGLTPEDARHEAVRRFGDLAGVQKWLRAHDHHRLRREARVEHMETVIQDVRYAARRLWQQPAFSLSVVLVLALGIGATTSMFSAVDAALLRPLPFHRDDQLVVLHDVHLPFALAESQTVAHLDDARALPAFQEIAAYAPGALNLGLGDAPARISVGVVTPNLFPMLGVSPVLGRHFAAAEGAPGAPAIALISHAIWRHHYAGSAEVLERDVVLNGKPYRIAGVMPPRLAFPNEA